MSPRHWFVAGWVFISTTAVLGAAGAVLVLTASSGHDQLYPDSSSQIVFQPSQSPSGLMLGIVLAVLAGVAFFSGMACFFWGAMADSRQRMTEILQSLHRSE